MAVRTPMRIGLVGCGNISDIYLQNGRVSGTSSSPPAPISTRKPQNRQAERYAIDARSVEDLLKSDDVDIVLNLTIPEAHAEVSLQAIEAGKHVYSEKPLATAVADGDAIVAAAKARGLARRRGAGHGARRRRSGSARAHRRRRNRQAADGTSRRDDARHGALAS